MRRYDIDWLRVIAIGLLLIYHIAIGFQSWGTMIGFIAAPKSWTALWTPMAMLNVWRIPLLFFVSGMGVYFAMQQRTWKQLILERTMRIWLPFVFGMFAIVPLHILVWRYYYKMELLYVFDPGHLWFLANIFVYVLVLSPILFYLKKNETGKVVQLIKSIFSTPLGLLIVVTAFIAEVMIIKPIPYELYAMTWHGFFLGLLAFLFGFCFVLSGSAFLADAGNMAVDVFDNCCWFVCLAYQLSGN
jgi:glucan biosynthesis protein C